MFNTVISFGNGISVSEEVLEKTVEEILQTIKSELPEEAQTYEVSDVEFCTRVKLRIFDISDIMIMSSDAPVICRP